MNILVTGSGRSGSWSIRGQQLGEAIGASVVPRALDVGGYDLAIVIKRTPGDVIERLHRFNVPIVWDVVDSWTQPEGNNWERAECMAWLRERVRFIRPVAIVAATKAMAADCAEFGIPVLALPHHARPGLARTQIRPLQVVAYEGGVPHLGNWAEWLEWECSARGLRFVMNPMPGTEVDVLVALRERTGYAPMNWKSNCKLANAQGSGTPIICAREAGYLETQSGGEIFADTREEVQWALETLQSVDLRRELSAKLISAAPSLESVAATYLAWLQTCVTVRKS